MSFPATTPTSAPQASALLSNNAANAGLTNATPFDRLTNLEQIVANLLTDAPAGFQLGAYTLGGAAAGGVGINQVLTKKVSAITDNTLTTFLTITVPNAANTASIRVRLCGILGAGGGVGASENAMSISYDACVTRTAGVAAVCVESSIYGSAASGGVAGADTMTFTATMHAVAGGNTATQTFAWQCTIHDSSGSATNHTCLVVAECMNALGSGVTIA